MQQIKYTYVDMNKKRYDLVLHFCVSIACFNYDLFFMKVPFNL